MDIIKKIPLHPAGISHTIEPKEKPTFQEWRNYITKGRGSAIVVKEETKK